MAEPEYPRNENVNISRQGDEVSSNENPLENIFKKMGVRMELTTLPEDVVRAAQKYLEPYCNLRIGEGVSPAPLTPEQRGEFLREFMHGLLEYIGYPDTQVGYLQDDKSFFNDRMARVAGYPGQAFLDSFSFRDSEGNTYVVEVGFIPRNGFEINIKYVPFKGTPTTSTPFATTPNNPAASVHESGA